MGEVAVVDALQRLDGTATAGQLVSICGRSALERALASGDVIRVARGRYVLPACPDPWVSAHRLGGVVSHSSAAAHWGLAVVGRAPTEIVVRRSRHGLASHGVTLHWADLSPGDIDRHVPVTTPLRTVLDCSRTLPFDQALAIADSAVRLGRVRTSELLRAADAQRGAGRGRIRRVAHAADGRSESALESCLRAHFITGGITGFVPQLVVADDSFRARVDLGDARRRIVAEADSFEHHGARQALVRDCERYDELVARGWRVLRFAWEQVMFRSAWIQSLVRVVIEQPACRTTGRSRP